MPCLLQDTCDEWNSVPVFQLVAGHEFRAKAGTKPVPDSPKVDEYSRSVDVCGDVPISSANGTITNIAIKTAHSSPSTPVQNAAKILTVLPVPLTAVIPYGGRNITTKKKNFNPTYCDCITFEQCISHLSSLEQKMHTEPRKRKKSATWKNNWLMRILFGPPQLERRYLEQREFIHTLSSTACQPLSDRLHGSMLYTVFKRLTGSSAQLSQGDHWKLIGFQGTDPATDFRGAGLLALLCLVFLVSELVQFDRIKRLFRLSIDPVQNFPFACVGINITSILLETLWEDRLNRLIHARRNVLDTFMLLYCALLFKLGDIWLEQKCTICDMHTTLKQLQQLINRNPEALLKWIESFEGNTN
ncbi:unnamed protein product [Echinostoma caproni]|uniref:ELMO domain-containing protein n=1 Tax=Echinostoma caproni TaxID=27848 RepID=A0A183AVP9_9TREM|nr:unnamed protein product [Echinostoma caproni]